MYSNYCTNKSTLTLVHYVCPLSGACIFAAKVNDKYVFLVDMMLCPPRFNPAIILIEISEPGARLSHQIKLIKVRLIVIYCGLHNAIHKTFQYSYDHL